MSASSALGVSRSGWSVSKAFLWVASLVLGLRCNVNAHITRPYQTVEVLTVDVPACWALAAPNRERDARARVLYCIVTVERGSRRMLKPSESHGIPLLYTLHSATPGRHVGVGTAFKAEKTPSVEIDESSLILPRYTARRSFKRRME